MEEGLSLRDSLTRLSPESLLWVMGLFCGFMGAFLLVAPHHFQTAPYEALLPYTLAWGTLALASGVGLLAVAVLRPRRWLECGALGLGGLTLLTLAASFVRVNATTGTVVYGTLGLGTLLACRLPRDRPRDAVRGGDLLALFMSLAGTLAGAFILALPSLFHKPFYGSYAKYLPLFGVAFLLTSPPAAVAQIAPAWRKRWPFHLPAGLVFMSFGLLVSVPGRFWTGMALYIGGGAVLAGLPWVRRRLAALDTASLRVRLALTLAVSTSLALVLATAVVTAQEERLAREQVRTLQEVEARSVAQNISDYIDMNGARTATLAAFAGRSPRTAEKQGELLAASRSVYPDLRALRTLSTDLRVLAGAGEAGLPLEAVRKVAQAVNRTRRTQLSLTSTREHSFLLMGSPVHNLSDDVAGTLVAAFSSEALIHRMTRQGAHISLADGYGHLIAAVSENPAGEALPALPPGWDQQVRKGNQVARTESVAGFAVVPRLGWIVAVERPLTSALAGVRRGRDLAFGLLLLVIPLTVIAGIFVSRRIARPLGDLSSAVDAMTAGDLAAPIPAGSDISEVARLSAAFQEMRERLAERTAESERLAAELRARADALAEADRRKDEFLAMLAHELRNPLGAIANASYLLEQLAPPEPQARPVAIIRRQIQHLVRMVDDLLDVSRITRGKIELRRQSVDLAEILRHATDASLPLAEAQEQTLRVELPLGPLPLDGDATRLEQVFTNLLRNAVKFTGRQGHVEISARRRDGEAVVLVSDDGAGISADLLPRIFDLFVQGEQGLDRSGAGLGIGLTLVRSLVEMHGGRVEARSDGPGQGSEFEVRLPLTPAGRGR
ncbi:MAG: ATP-binding protein [Thermoanaerobaculia bacterium]